MNSLRNLIEAIAAFESEHGGDPEYEAVVEQLKEAVAAVAAPEERGESPGEQEAKEAGAQKPPPEEEPAAKPGLPEERPPEEEEKAPFPKREPEAPFPKGNKPFPDEDGPPRDFVSAAKQAKKRLVRR